MNQAESHNNANSLICALSGQSPIQDPVVTPSGRICSKRLLLSKLVETSGRDPFNDAYLDESKLIEIQIPFADTLVAPPRLSGSNTFPALLNTLQGEYDALILELYDTRKALEETRRELSMALYQNDAAVRVIARTLTERDAARAELSRFSGTLATNTVSSKRKRVEEEDEPFVADNHALESFKPEDDGSKTPNVVEMDVEDSATKTLQTIPHQEMKVMIQKRDELSVLRKLLIKKAKQDADKEYATTDTFKCWQPINKKNLHKTSSKPGILALAGAVIGISPHTKILTHGRDKQIIVYSTSSETIVKSIPFKSTIAFLDIIQDTTAGIDWIYVCDLEGIITSYTGTDFESTASLSLTMSEKEKVVGMKTHPSGRILFVVTNHGRLYVLSLTEDGSKLTVVTNVVVESLNHEAEYSCAGLHPDGLLIVAGRSDGKICLWDLQSCTVASGFVGVEGASITKIVMSENGYHMAAASTSGDVSVWDLRKSTKVDSFQIPSNGESNNENVHMASRLSFCPLGKTLAIGTSHGQVFIGLTKDLSQGVSLPMTLNHDGGISGLLWGVNAQSLITTNHHDRSVQFWGTPSKDA